MISMKQWMELVNYRVTEGSDYGWACYGPNSYTLDSHNNSQGTHSCSIVYSTKSQKVYEVTVCDYVNNRAYRMVNANNRARHNGEAEQRGVRSTEAWDDVDFVDLTEVEDFVEKATAIIASEPYDTRVLVQVTFSDEDLLRYMKIAHERDITFNALVEQALWAAVAATDDPA